MYDWAYAGTVFGIDRSEHVQYRCNATPGRELTSICDDVGLVNNDFYWDELNLDTLLFKQDRISEVFLLNDMRDPLTPVSVTNNGPNLLASGSPGVSVELQEIELCNPDVDDNATGVGMTVSIPSSIRLEDVYTDASGTMPLVSTIVSDDGINKIYNCLLYTSPSPRDKRQSRMPSSA